MLLLLAVSITPIETIAMNYLLTVHLVQNVVLAEVGALLFALGIPRPSRSGRLRCRRCPRSRSGS